MNSEKKMNGGSETVREIRESVEAVKAAVRPDGSLSIETDVHDDLVFLAQHADRTLLSHHTYTTGGMVSWESEELAFVVDGNLALVSFGDLSSEVPDRFLPLPDDADQLAAHLATWISNFEAHVPMAIALEAFDPDSTLDGSGQEVWRRRLSTLRDTSRHAYDCVEAELDADVRTRLRALLAENRDYLRAAEALAHPNSAAGRALGFTLDQLEETGVASLVAGEWLQGDLVAWRDRRRAELDDLRTRSEPAGVLDAPAFAADRIEGLERELAALDRAISGTAE